MVTIYKSYMIVCFVTLIMVTNVQTMVQELHPPNLVFID